MTPLDLDHLEALADRASPGDWLVDGDNVAAPDALPGDIVCCRPEADFASSREHWAANAAFIAAASPAVVKMLIARLRTLETRAGPDRSWRPPAQQTAAWRP